MARKPDPLSVPISNIKPSWSPNRPDARRIGNTGQQPGPYPNWTLSNHTYRLFPSGIGSHSVRGRNALCGSSQGAHTKFVDGTRGRLY